MFVSLGQFESPIIRTAPSGFFADIEREAFGGQPTMLQALLAFVGASALLIWGARWLEKEARQARKRLGL
jgi:hypothetical protein